MPPVDLPEWLGQNRGILLVGGLCHLLDDRHIHFHVHLEFRAVFSVLVPLLSYIRVLLLRIA